jgi:hypothetical protein
MPILFRYPIFAYKVVVRADNIDNNWLVDGSFKVSAGLNWIITADGSLGQTERVDHDSEDGARLTTPSEDPHAGFEAVNQDGGHHLGQGTLWNA